MVQMLGEMTSIDFQNGAGSAQGTGATMFGYLVRTVSAGATVRMKVYCDVTTGNARIDGSSYEPTYFFGYKLTQEYYGNN